MESTQIYIIIFLICALIIFLPKEIVIAMIVGAALIVAILKYKPESFSDVSLPDINPLVQAQTEIVGTSELDNSDEVMNLLNKNSTTSDFLNSSPISDEGLDLDHAIMQKTAHTNNLNKRAIDGRVRTTKKLYEKYFENELAEQEDREWWSAEASPIETDFRAYQ